MFPKRSIKFSHFSGVNAEIISQFSIPFILRRPSLLTGPLILYSCTKKILKRISRCDDDMSAGQRDVTEVQCSRTGG